MQSNSALPQGHFTVPAGHIATVVTSLEMLVRAEPRPAQPLPAGLELTRLDRPSVETYRKLFRAIGTDWLWFSRLVMPDPDLTDILQDPDVEIHALRRDGQDLGILELDFRQRGTCELAYFGLASEAVGNGVGRTLMNEAIRRAWLRPIDRFWVHTCTLDHPAAIDFYRRSGFTPFAFQVEIAPDPRLIGVMPRDCAPHIPLLPHLAG